jgi:hypothetical protein
MKKTLLVLCLLSTTAALAQYSANSLNNQVTIPQFQSHEAHANYAPMSAEQNILATTSFASARGDRPASDFPHVEGVSLGAFAREYRKQHAELRKSRVVWINQ